MKATKKVTIVAILAVLIAWSPLIGAEQREEQGQDRQGKPGTGQVKPEGTRDKPVPGQRQRGSRTRQVASLSILRLLRQVGLTDEQQKRVNTIATEAAEPGRNARNAIRVATMALRKAVVEEASEKQLKELASKVGQKMGEQAVGQVRTTKSIKAVLTGEQLEKLEKILQQQRTSRRRGQDRRQVPQQGKQRETRPQRERQPDKEQRPR